MRSTAARALMIVALVVGSGRVAAQPAAAPPSAEAPPVAISGWRYEKGLGGLHIFRCAETGCGTESKVSYQLYPPGTTMTLERFRRDQEVVVKALEQRMPAGTRIVIVSIEGDPGTTGPRMYKSQRLIIAPDGTKEYWISGVMVGRRGAASLISSSRDEKTNNGNYALFALPLMLLLQLSPAEAKPQ